MNYQTHEEYRKLKEEQEKKKGKQTTLAFDGIKLKGRDWNDKETEA